MESQNGNDNKRMINITMNIELKNSELGKADQDLVKNVTKDFIDAALTATNTINNAEAKGTPSDNEEMARLRRRFDYNKKKSKNENPNTSVTNTTESVNFGAKIKTSKNERKATSTVKDKGVETGAMKRVRLSLEHKKLKKNENHATKSVVSISKTCENNVTRAKKTKDPKGDSRITNEDKDKPTIETEAMKRIRLSLELKNKSKTNKNNNKTATSSTSSPSTSTRTCQNVEVPGNAKNPGKGIKRKLADVSTDKTHVDSEGMKKIKLNNSRQNENLTNTRTSEITIEQMDIDNENGPYHRKKRANAATGPGSKKNNTKETTSTTEKVGVETEAMKMIRRRLEIKKNNNNNENSATSTITSTTSNTGTPTGAYKDKEQLKSPKHVQRKTATVDKQTEEVEIMKALKQQREQIPTSTTSNAATSDATVRKTIIKIKNKPGHKYNKSVAKYNLTPIEITDDECNENPVHEITDDEYDENPVHEITDDECNQNSVHEITDDEHSEINKNNENKHKNVSRSSCRCRSAMMDVDEPDDIAITDTGRVTRSKTWERRVYK